MFSFFKKPAVSIASVNLPDFGWPKAADSADVKSWMSATHRAMASVNFISLKPDLPTAKDVNLLRDFYRSRIAAANGGLIQVDIVYMQGVPSVKTIFKVAVEHGMVYVASITIPFEDYSFVLKVQAGENGVTGIREAIVMDKLLALGKITLTDTGLEGWMADPYNPAYNTGVVMNRSEAVEYDSEFPDHPLTIVRNRINELQNGTTFQPEIEKLRPFNR